MEAAQPSLEVTMAMVRMLSQQIHTAALVVEGVLQVEPLEATTVEAEVAVEGLAAAEAVDLPTKHRSLASVRIAFARPALLGGPQSCPGYQIAAVQHLITAIQCNSRTRAQ